MTARLIRARDRGSRPRLPTLLALLIGIALAIASPLGAAPAGAAGPGRMVSIGGWQLGAFLSSTGHYVYCIEPGAAEPSAAQRSPQTVTSLPGYTGSTFDPTGWNGTVTSGVLSGAKLRQINYLLWTHGRTKDTGTAAAVQLAVWILRGDPGAKAWLDHHLAWARSHGGSGYVDHAQQLAKDARAKAVAAKAPTPAPLVVEADGTEGAGSVRYPAGVTRLTISGGAFADGARELAVGGGGAGEAAWRANPHEHGWLGLHEVRISAAWELPASGWPARIRVFPPEVEGQQRLAAGVGPVTSTFEGVLEGAARIDLRFSPVLATRVRQRFLSAGSDAFADTVVVSAAEGSGAWPTRPAAGGVEGGSPLHAPIVAEGVVYGPFDAPLEPSDEAPGAAPIAARARLVADRGPGEYEVAAPEAPAAPGYYYWVWSIDEAAQVPEVRAGGLLPDDYRFTDRFGLVEEGHVVPTALRWSTNLLRRELRVDDLVLRDRVTAAPEGGAWLRDASGEPIPARLRLTAYASDVRPTRQERVPANAREVGHGFVEIARSGEPVEAAPIALPAGTRGWVTVRTCLLAEDQPEERRGYLEEWCDDYGVPAETARIAAPDLLAETGARGAAVGAPLLGAGLLGSGVLLLAGFARQRGRDRARSHARRSTSR